MNIHKDQILQLLRSQGKNDQASQASQASSELPGQIDTDNPQHAALLSKYGVDKDSLGGKLGGLGSSDLSAMPSPPSPGRP